MNDGVSGTSHQLSVINHLNYPPVGYYRQECVDIHAVSSRDGDCDDCDSLRLYAVRCGGYLRVGLQPVGYDYRNSHGVLTDGVAGEDLRSQQI